MSPKLPVLLLLASLPAGAEAIRQPADQVTTEKVDFTPGGVIRIEHSAGELNIQAWDEPQVEVTVTREDWVHDKGKDRDQATEREKNDKVTVTKNGTDIVISTVHKHSFGINLDYRIMVPKNAGLLIRHETGDVIIDGVDADIDASIHAGDILLLLPEAGAYAFDARVTSGGVYSDFGGNRHHAALDGETFVADAPAPARKIHLHVGLGGIEIQKMLPFRDPAAEPPPTQTTPTRTSGF